MTTDAGQATDSGVLLTDGAAQKVHNLLEAEGRTDLSLRIAVEPGGCQFCHALSRPGDHGFRMVSIRFGRDQPGIVLVANLPHHLAARHPQSHVRWPSMRCCQPEEVSSPVVLSLIAVPFRRRGPRSATWWSAPRRGVARC